MPAPRPKVQIRFQPTDVNAAADDAFAEPVGHELTTRLTPGARWFLLALVLSTIAIASTAPAIHGAFLPQDDAHVTNNLALRTWQGLRPIWLSPQRMEAPYPITFTSYLIQHRIFRDVPTGYHVVSALLHAVVTVLLWTLLRKLEVPGAIIAAALFAVHPVQVATVAWIAQQKVLWCALFYLSALLVFFRFCEINPSPPLEDEFDASIFRLPRSRASLYVIAMLLLMLALASQAMAVTFAPVVLVAIWWKRGQLTRDDLKPLILPAVLTVVAGVAFAIIEFRHGARGGSYPTILQRLQLIGWTFWTDLRIIVAPFGLNYVYARFALRAAALWHYLPTIAVIGLFIALWRMRQTIGRGPFAAAALFGALVLPYAGAVNFKWMERSFVADHLLYLACAVPIIAVASGSTQVIQSNRKLPVFALPIAAALLVLALVSMSIVRASDYRSPKALWTAALARNPRLITAHNALGEIAQAAGNHAEASRHFARALELDDGNVATHLKVAQLYQETGQPDLALGEFHQVLRREPDNADAHFGVARILAGQNDSRGAMREYETVLTLRPDDVRAHLNLGQLHEERSEYEAAMRSYAEAVRIDPRNVLARQNYGLLLFRAGAIEQAMDQMRTILEKLDPNFYPGWLNAAAMTARQGDLLGDPQKKIEHYLQAAEYLRVATIVNKESADAYRQRGIVLMKLSLLQPRQPALGSISEAIAAFRRAVELKPDDAEAAHFAQAAEVERQRRQDSRDAR